jgi:hypothetical protein
VLNNLYVVTLSKVPSSTIGEIDKKDEREEVEGTKQPNSIRHPS